MRSAGTVRVTSRTNIFSCREASWKSSASKSASTRNTAARYEPMSAFFTVTPSSESKSKTSPASVLHRADKPMTASLKLPAALKRPRTTSRPPWDRNSASSSSRSYGRPRRSAKRCLRVRKPSARASSSASRGTDFRNTSSTSCSEKASKHVAASTASRVVFIRRAFFLERRETHHSAKVEALIRCASSSLALALGEQAPKQASVVSAARSSTEASEERLFKAKAHLR
mmetsp:Transcript_1778/g.5288  ORF Transcript_1778/g.5288 Transcript_1778/m.5288 type:complete len:228 (+) Transcript_1778:289-972(+)